MDFGVATDRGTDSVAHLNASANFTALSTSQQKSWQTSFTTDKGFKSFFFFSFPVINLALQKGSKNDFLSSTNLSWKKASKCLFPISSACKRPPIISLSTSRSVVKSSHVAVNV